MLVGYKRKANVSAVAGIAAIVAAHFVPVSREQADPSDLLPVMALVAAGDLLFLCATWLYARSKGFHGAWGLLVPAGFSLISICWFYAGPYRDILKRAGIAIAVAGLLVVALLPDRHPFGRP